MSHRCLYGARCVPAPDARSATCRCDWRCDVHEDAPVCGEDGRDYPSKCHLRQSTCLNMTSVAVKYNGSCGMGITRHELRCGGRGAIPGCLGAPTPRDLVAGRSSLPVYKINGSMSLNSSPRSPRRLDQESYHTGTIRSSPIRMSNGICESR